VTFQLKDLLAKDNVIFKNNEASALPVTNNLLVMTSGTELVFGESCDSFVFRDMSSAEKE